MRHHNRRLKIIGRLLVDVVVEAGAFHAHGSIPGRRGSMTGIKLPLVDCIPRERGNKRQFNRIHRICGINA
jgi:hypothetical protein